MTILLIATSCIVENPINGKKQIKFEVVSLPDSIPVDSILCRLEELKTIAHSPVAEGYTNAKGECYIDYDFKYEKFISFQALLANDENSLVSKYYQGKHKYYSVVGNDLNILDLARKNEFKVKMVLLPLGTLRLVFDKKGIDYERMIIHFYKGDKIVQGVDMGNRTDSMNFYVSALDTLKVVCSLTKNNVIVSSQTDICKLDSFTTQRKQIIFK
jgi:hypothetical protein